MSPRTAALGGAGHAGPILNDAIYMNPSYAAFTPSYGLEANYLYYNSPAAPDGSEDYHGHLTNFSVQDGRNPLFQAGVGYSLRDQGKLLNIGAAKAAIQQLGFGIGGKFYFPNSGSGFADTIVSTTFVATSWLQVAAIVDNAVQSSNAVAQGFYRQYILGTKLNVKSIMLIYADPHLTPNAPNQPMYGYETGVELTPFNDLFFRGGLFRNSATPELNNLYGRGYGFGFGWLGPRISLDYGLRHVVNPVQVVSHNFGVTIFF
ncbi:MAG: hypothetical protein P4M08_00490 [Oligoflexia bacterium]|nr:hypothetical protein [Oligoflexia bacterium]